MYTIWLAKPTLVSNDGCQYTGLAKWCKHIKLYTTSIYNKLPSVNLMRSGQGMNEHHQHKTTHCLCYACLPPLPIPFHLSKALSPCSLLTGYKRICNAGRVLEHTMMSTSSILSSFFHQFHCNDCGWL